MSDGKAARAGVRVRSRDFGSAFQAAKVGVLRGSRRTGSLGAGMMRGVRRGQQKRSAGGEGISETGRGPGTRGVRRAQAPLAGWARMGQRKPWMFSGCVGASQSTWRSTRNTDQRGLWLTCARNEEGRSQIAKCMCD